MRRKDSVLFRATCCTGRFFMANVIWDFDAIGYIGGFLELRSAS